MLSSGPGAGAGVGPGAGSSAGTGTGAGSGAGAGAGAASASALGRLLSRRPPTTINWGLERIRFLLAGLGDPHRSFRAIHVAGTNGKGSVAATAESILRAGGHRTGLYTSPHLVAFSERIAIDGRPAELALLEDIAAELLPLAAEANATFFESVTALGFAAFARRGVETAVVEVGLGGRLDATNVLDAPVAVITSIDLDHADYLGSDLAVIAREKAAIIAPAATLVLGPVDGVAREAILEAAETAGARVLRYGEEVGVTDVAIEGRAGGPGRAGRARGASGARSASGARGARSASGTFGTNFVYSSDLRPGGLRLSVPLHGRQQAINAALAVAAVDAFEAVPPREDVIRGGVGTVRWPGRFDLRMREDGAWLYDIAHNPAAAELLATLVDEMVGRSELPRPVVLLAGVLGDKDWAAVLGPLLAATDGAVFTDPPSAPPERRWDLREAGRLAEGIEVEPDFDRALVRARALATADGTVLVTGSCHTVGDALRRE
ncbi:MAG: bifunctional folylpolyglutamate synthase/dihydrofolate synthase [Gemmatimonadota bacterium]